MRTVRKSLRIALLILWFLFCALLALPGRWRGRRGIRQNLKLTRFWARGAARIIGLRVVVDGDPGQFPGGLVVSNHQGYLDIVVEATVFPIRFAPKAEIASWPFLGPFVGLNQPVWIHREARGKSVEVAREIEWSLKNNLSMLVYPEGTSTSGEVPLLPFKSTPFEPVIAARLPIQPVLVRYRLPADGRELSWHGDMTLLPHISHLLGQPRLDARLRLLPVIVPQPGETRKELALRVHDLMDAEYRRMQV